MDNSSLPYDPRSVESIEKYAQRLIGHTLREMTDAPKLQDPKRRRGSYGNAVEEYYFRYSPNSDPAPDFREAGLELKTTPMKRNKNGSLVAKERMVITDINYMTVIHEVFERSHFLEKSSSILLIAYLWKQGQDLLDYQIILARKWRIPSEDMPQIKLDWEVVVAKVRTGHAEAISGSDTLYLEACTKAADSSVRRPQPYSDVPAKPRAWAFKASYMTAIESGMLNSQPISRAAEERDMALLELVRHHFSPYLNLTREELCSRFGINSHAKQATALITKRILGVERSAEIAEFEKAGIAGTKTIRLLRSGRPAEAVSFPAFDYYELEQTPFEQSDLYRYLRSRWLFIVFRADSSGSFRLSDVLFWQMPDSDIPEARRCYEQMRRNVHEGHAEISVKPSENRCCHVRPHGRDAHDTLPQPHSSVPVVKKCFWLNQSYLQVELEKASI